MNSHLQLMGLSEAEAKKRLVEHGFNEIDERKANFIIENLLKILFDPMSAMLLILSAVYWFLGQYSEALVLLIAFFPIAAVDVALEMRSKKALRALKKSLKTSCYVLRDGKTISIPIRHLVPGDFIILEEGQMLPADGKLLETTNLTIDESSVTGESIPVEKAVGDEILSGTTIVTGGGISEILRTGATSQLGVIAEILREFEAEPSPLLKTIKRVVRYVFIIAVILAALVFAVSLLNNHGIGESLISALTLAMASIPEEFPLVFTLYLSLAAYRLSQKGILVKSLPSVEGLARVDVICTDKTGTLTEGKFHLEQIYSIEPQASSEICKQVLVFACEPKAVDAMEASIFEWVRSKWGEEEIYNLHAHWNLQYDYPFELKKKYMCHVWQENQSDRQFLAMKGALEGVLALCKTSVEQKEKILKIATQEARGGKRLLAVAYKEGVFTGDRASDESELTFLGILSFTDPIRPSVPTAIDECKKRNIRLKMLTGDHLLTAHAIADAIDLPHEHSQLFTGPDLEKLSLEDKKLAYQKGAIFARLKPEQKLELVKALKEEGDVVAMTGDGINDAPALKLADVGISMGERATDVARSAAQLVLLKNDFGGIIDSIIEGQNVLKSLSESFGYLIAFHIPIISIALVQAFFLNAPILYPIHVVLLELIVHPISTFVFVESETFKNTKFSFLSKERLFWSATRGILLTLLSVLVFYYADEKKLERSSLAVLMIITGNIGLLLGEKGGIFKCATKCSWSTVVASLLLLLIAAMLSYVPIFSRIFMISPPQFSMLMVLSLIGFLLGAVGPIKKR
ncbi:MAG: cation-transporting P-type ATPase [Bdellovibrionaceae bacterium]|nr:cation-transporting P-type ATPase [Pseudobdellovibrionaceae bacterium]